MMENLLLYPPLAFLVFVGLATVLQLLGGVFAGQQKPTEMKSSLYGSGEAVPAITSGPGYRQFFVIALFFAILHLGVLILGSGELNWISGAYLVGLMLALIALILG